VCVFSLSSVLCSSFVIVARYCFCTVCVEGSILVQAMSFGVTLSFDKLDK